MPTLNILETIDSVIMKKRRRCEVEYANQYANHYAIAWRKQLFSIVAN